MMWRNSGFGCTNHGIFLGAIIYADDIFLLSASRTGLQVMINVSNEFASEMNLKFGTNIDPKKSKTKGIIFTKSRRTVDSTKELQLDGYSLPWVSQVDHLGHILQVDNSMVMDIAQKRGAFIGKVNSLLQEFHYASSSVLLKFLQTYACNIYGSNVWDLFSPECNRIYTSFNVALRNILNLPRTTHRYLLEPISKIPHIFVQLMSRYATFTKSLLHNEALEVRFLSRISIEDMRTTLGRSMARIADLCDRSDADTCEITANLVKSKVKYQSISENEEWRIGIIEDMTNILNGNGTIVGLENDKVLTLLEYACIS